MSARAVRAFIAGAMIVLAGSSRASAASDDRPPIGVPIAAPSTAGSPTTAGSAEAQGSSASSPAAEAATTRSANDPLEPVNRVMFAFNENFDTYFLKPVATGWDFVVPRLVERGIENFFDNIRFPIRFVNQLLQGRIDPAAITLSRFAVNTTIGIAGFIDVGTFVGLPVETGDFGQTLGVWGVPPGPYLVWPIFGSSNPRDSAGLAADAYIGIATFFVNFYYLAGARVLDTVNSRALVLDEVSSARDASFDFYTAVRSAYDQRREAMIRGTSAPTPEQEQDLYFPDYSGQEVLE